ncbi:MAG: glycosyltransferase family 1 protein [Usitatibacteraceae bacterium]
MKLLLELRPALDGHAGIPQETRLLFRGLRMVDGLDIEGLIIHSGRVLAKGLPADAKYLSRPLSADREIYRLSRVIISLEQSLHPTLLKRTGIELTRLTGSLNMVLTHLLGASQKLTRFDPLHFRDFIWRNFFAKTLPHSDFELVTKAKYRVARLPWTMMHLCGLNSRQFGYHFYPRLNTSDFDVLIAQTPFPGTVSKKTKLVVRYHDAIPVLMPHTISDKIFHQASHFHALKHNVESGAYFACVSDSTRNDLLSIFPEAADRALTVHNMVSHHYYPEDSSPARVPEIVRTRLHSGVKVSIVSSANDATGGQSGAALVLPNAGATGFEYLLMVSTIEPRKNHLSLLSAWEQLRTENFPNLKLVIVGMLGWNFEPIVKKFKTWQERGELFLLEDVPSPELRLLYRHARATICPSFAEGFDFSGVEAMRCGGAVVASRIPVHEEIYGDAAEFFSPYSTVELSGAIEAVIGVGKNERRSDLISRGAVVSARYLPEVVLPKWREFLQTKLAK